jgi:ABC-type transporter Mla subunit MlaD
MSAKVNHFRLGVFVLAGLAAVFALIVVLGTGEIFKDSIYLETYFDESVQGLSEGSPLKYRGVSIGTVVAIELCDSIYELGTQNPEHEKCGRFVYIKVAYTPPRRAGRREKDSREITLQRLSQMIGRGLRVRLASQGITGLAYLEADFHNPEEHPAMAVPWTPENLYIPTARSTFTVVTESVVKILASLDKVRFDEIGRNLDALLTTLNATTQAAQVETLSKNVESLLRSVRETIESPEVKTLLANASAASQDVREMVAKVRPGVESFDERLKTFAEKTGRLLDDVDALLKRPELEVAVKELPATIAQLKLALKQWNSLAESSRNDLQLLLENLTTVSENIKQLSEGAKKYPALLLFGEPPKPISPP